MSTGITEDDILEDHYNFFNFEIIYRNESLIQDDPNYQKVAGKGSVGLYLVERAHAYNEPGILILSFMESMQKKVYEELFEPCSMGLKEKYEIPVIERFRSLNVLVINRIEVLPEFRGKGFFKRTVNLLRHFFYGCYGIEAAYAIPAQYGETFEDEQEQTSWRQEMQYGKFSQDPRLARKAIRNLMKKSQYSRTRNTDIYYHIPGKSGIFRDADYFLT